MPPLLTFDNAVACREPPGLASPAARAPCLEAFVLSTMMEPRQVRQPAGPRSRLAVADANAERTQMADSSSITDLVKRLRRGDSDAARELFAYYADRLRRLAEQHLSRRLAGRVEAEDVVQSALRTFFSRSARGEFQIDSRADLWHLLVRITVVKARQQARHHQAARRDVRVEQGEGDEDWLLRGRFSMLSRTRHRLIGRV